MTPHYSESPDPRQDSDITSFELVTLDELESPAVREGAGYWRTLRGNRRYPARKDILPRDIASILRNMILIKVIDGCSDFEFRIAGDAQVQAHAIPFQGRRLNQLMQIAPAFCLSLRSIFIHVVLSGAPAAVRGRMGADFPNAKYTYCESMFLPLGAGDDAVDHLMMFSTYVARTFVNGKN